MRELAPPLPDGRPERFRSTVHGTVFADRARHLERLNPGDSLRLIPDPLGDQPPAVWVHLPTGEPVGHLPPEIAGWLAPWLLSGGLAQAHAIAVHGREVPSWRRVLLEISCL